MSEKKCSYHGILEPIENFYKNPKSKDGYQDFCKKRNAEFAAISYQRDKEKTQLSLSDPPICVECGFDNPTLLQFDHVNGGGAQHRKKIAGTKYHRYIREHLDEFQLLCPTCNLNKKLVNKEMGKEYFEKHSGVEYPSTKPKIHKWARDFDCCVKCETTDIKHHGKGLCMNCFQVQYGRSKGVPERRARQRVANGEQPWHKEFDCCVACGTTTIPFKGHGMCENCHRRSLKRMKKMEI